MRKFLDLKEVENLKRDLFSGVSYEDAKREGADMLTKEMERFWDAKFDKKFDEKQFDVILSKIDEPIALFSFGEGEISFIEEKKSANQREVFTDEARRGLIEAIKMSKRPDVYLTTILGGIADRSIDAVKNREFMKVIEACGGEIKDNLYSARIFYQILERAYNRKEDGVERIKQFIRKLREKKVCLVGAKPLLSVFSYLKDVELVETPNLGGTCWLDFIQEKIEETDADIYLFSCGIAGNCLIARTFSEKNKPMLDVGSFWDMLVGIGTRREESYSPPLIKPNEI